MRYEQALDWLHNGQPKEDGTRWGPQPIRRAGWSACWFVHNWHGDLMLRLPGVGDVPFHVCRDDAEAEDWGLVIVQGTNLRSAPVHRQGCGIREKIKT